MGILALTIILFVILIPLIAVGELNRVLPQDELKQLFMQPRGTEISREQQRR